MRNRNNSLKLMIILIGILLVLSFAIQYANNPPPPKEDTTKKTETKAPGEEEHPSLVGKPPMDFTMASVANGPVTLSQFKDKESVVLLFASRLNKNFSDQVKLFTDMEAKYKSKNVRFIIVSMSEPIAKTREYAEKNGVKIMMLADLNGAVAMQYLQAATANCIFISKNGLIYATQTNAAPEAFKNQLETTVKNMVSGKAPVTIPPVGSELPPAGLK